jgi:hypothetical protein
MEIEKICSLVKAAWVFSKKNYPFYLRFSPSEQQIFAMNHVLKHQAKAINFLSRGSRKRSETQNAIHRVLFNSIRFAIILEINPSEISLLLDTWKPSSEGAKISRKLKSTMDDNMHMVAQIKRLQWSTNNALTLLEPCDRGNRLHRTKMRKVATECIQTSLEIASLAACTREEFEVWLESCTANNVLDR